MVFTLLWQGWIECVGHADRSCFDLGEHARVTKVDMTAYERWDEPRMVEVVQRTINKKKLGPKFRKDAGIVLSYLDELPRNQAMKLQEQLDFNGSAIIKPCNDVEYKIESDMVKYEIVTEKQSGDSLCFYPMEPIADHHLYCRHYVHAGSDRAIVRHRTHHLLPPGASLLCSGGIRRPGKGRVGTAATHRSHQDRDPASQQQQGVRAHCQPALYDRHQPLPSSLSSSAVRKLTSAGIATSNESSSASIGKRYARADEIGVPFAITVDFDTLSKSTVTVRERDSMQQIRLKVRFPPTHLEVLRAFRQVDEVVSIVKLLISGEMDWTSAYNSYEQFFAQETA